MFPSSPFSVPCSHSSSSSVSSSSIFCNAFPVQPLQKKRPTADVGTSQQQLMDGAPPPAVTTTTTTAQQSSGEKTAPAKCICERDPALVVCRRCGHDLVGRVQLCCPLHPKRISLMDLRECPNPACRSVQLSEVNMAVPK